MSIIEKYIGIIKSLTDNGIEFGTCFFISEHTAITAKHVVDKGNVDYTLEANNRIVSFKQEQISDSESNNYAIINFNEIIFDYYEYDSIKFNINFQIQDAQALPWSSIGYVQENGKICKKHIGGNFCSKCLEKYEYVLSSPIPLRQTYKGMSGSPVIINNLIVGVLQVQEFVEGKPENLYITSSREFAGLLDYRLNPEDVYNNILISKKNYDGLFDISGLSPRDISFGKDKRIGSLSEILTNHNNQKHYILLGEAGLGKTKELQRFAVESCVQKHTLYSRLKDFVSVQSLEEFIPEIRDYLHNKVPFQLVMDGYDEIRNVQLRDEIFPGLLEQLIRKIQESGINDYSILISTRTAFYYDNKFSGFEELILNPLSKNAIDAELNKNQIDLDLFYSEIENKQLYSFVGNPFYLSYMIKLFLDNSSQLPSKKELMDRIISYLYVRQNKGVFSPQEYRESIKLLERLAVCFIMRPTNAKEKTNFEFYQMIESHTTKEQRDLVMRSGIIDVDEHDEWVYKHNNFCEYLASKYLNDLYDDEISGLLNVIAYENGKGIFNNFKNLVTYLLLIREKEDLKEWILTNCPNTIKVLENEDITNEMKLERLRSLMDEANHKGYYLLYDTNENYDEIINNKDTIRYLLRIIQEETDPHFLTNALQLLKEIKNMFGLDNQIRNSIIAFMKSGMADIVHKSDSISVICDLNLSNELTTRYFFVEFSNCREEGIQNSLDRYILKNQVADLFSDLIINQYIEARRQEFVSFRIYDCLSQFQSVESIGKLFVAIMSIQQIENRISPNSEIIKVLTGYNQVLINASLEEKNLNSVINKIIDFTLFMASHYIIRANIFADTINHFGCGLFAVEKYFHNTGKNFIIFQTLSKDLNGYASFLVKGYSENLFVGKKKMFFSYCVREMDKTSSERELCLKKLKTSDSPTKEDDIRYITNNDDYLEKEKRKKALLAEYVFNFSLFRNEIEKIIHASGKTNPSCNDIHQFVYNSYQYNSMENVTYEFLREILNFSENILGSLRFLEANTNIWIMASSSVVIKRYQNNALYMDCFDGSQFEKIRKIVVSFLSELNIHKYNQKTLKSALFILTTLDFDLAEELMHKLLLIPEELFDGEKSLGFSDYITKRLSTENICSFFESNIQNKYFIRPVAEAFFYFCNKKRYSSDTIISYATQIIEEGTEDIAFYHAWNYLIEMEEINPLIQLIIDNKIDKNFFINHVFALNNFPTEELNDYVLDLFNEIQIVYCNDIQDDELDSVIHDYPYIITFHSSPMTVEKFKREALQCLRYLFGYLFRNNVNDSVNSYLDEMIENKTYSIFEKDTYSCLISEISSPCYLEKILCILRLICEDQFIKTRPYSSIFTETEKAYINISKSNPEKAIELLKIHLYDDDIRFRREANLLYDKIYCDLYEKTNKEFSVEEIEQVVFQ